MFIDKILMLRMVDNEPVALEEISAILWSKIGAERLKNRTFEFLKIPSPTGGEKCFSNYFRDSLKEIGMKVKMTYEYPNTPNVIGRYKFSKGETLQFDGHTDTIDKPHDKPYVKYGLIYGRGACDMKGSLSAMVEAVRIIIESGIKLKGALMITGHGLHEAPLGRNEPLDELIKNRQIGDAVVVGECAHKHLPIEGKGLAIFEILIKRKGKSVHELKGKGIANPIWMGNEILSKLRKNFFVGKFEGGDFYNRIPTNCKIVGTRRYSYGLDIADVKEELRDIISRVNYYPGLKIYLDIKKCADGFKISPRTKVAKSLKKAYKIVTGYSLKESTISVVGNLPWFVKAGVPSIYHGLDQVTAHADVECISLKELVRLTKVYISLIIDYLGGPQ